MRTSKTVFALVFVLLSGCAARRALAPELPALHAQLPEVDDCAAFDNEGLHRDLDRLTESELRSGNAVELLVNGGNSWKRRFANAEDADLILVKTFIFTEDEAGREVAELLKRRAAAGATVMVQYDIIGTIGGSGKVLSLYDASESAHFFRNAPLLAELEEAGVRVVPTNVPHHGKAAKRWDKAREDLSGEKPKVGLWGRITTMRGMKNFDHEKYWITGHVDDETGAVELRAIMGGLNIASEYAYGGTDRVDPDSGRGGWRDTDIEVRGPAALDITRRYFDAMTLHEAGWWEEAPPLDREPWEQEQPEVGEARVRFVWNQPVIGNRRRVERLYRSLIQAVPADGAIRMEMAYFTPGSRIRRPLQARLRKDARLAVLTNSPESTDMGIVAVASRGIYDELLEVDPDAALFEWLPREGLNTLHSKVASFGTCGPVVVGSANMDGQSSEHNSESVVLVYDAGFREAFDQMFEADIAEGSADRLTAEELAQTSTMTRWYRRGVYRIGWFFLGA